MKRTKAENRRFYGVIFASGIGGGLISLLIGLRQSVWFDEAYSINIAQHTLGELIHLTALDIHPPLYYMVLKIWGMFFGYSELALRSFSALALVGAIIVAGLLIKRLFTTRIALYATPLLALAPLLLRYGFEIRMYALGSLIGIAATYLLVRAVQAQKTVRRNWLIAYALVIAIGLYVQYFLILLWGAHAIWLVMTEARKKHFWRSLKPYLYAFGGGAILFLPWLTTFLHQLGGGVLAPIGKQLDAEQLIGILSFNVLYQPLYAVNIWLTFALVLLIVTLAMLALNMRKTIHKYRAGFLLLGLYIVVPVVFVMLMSLFMSPYTERYLLHVAIGLIMLIAILLAMFICESTNRARTKAIAAIIVYGCFLIGTIQLINTGNFNFQRMELPSANRVAASIKTCGAPAQLVVESPYEAIELGYYLPHCNVYFISPWPTLIGGYAPLNGSKLQIKSLDELTSPRVIFIHHGSTDSYELPSSYKLSSDRQFEQLHASEYAK